MSYKSLIADICTRLDIELDALSLIKYGFAGVASHSTINRHYEHITVCFEQLASLRGEQAAIEEICEKVDLL